MRKDFADDRATRVVRTEIPAGLPEHQGSAADQFVSHALTRTVRFDDELRAFLQQAITEVDAWLGARDDECRMFLRPVRLLLQELAAEGQIPVTKLP